MTSTDDWVKVKALEDNAQRCGMRVMMDQYSTRLALIPDGDALPVYSRTAKLMEGDVDTLLCWLYGWQVSREYLGMLKLANGDKITKAEDNHKARLDKAREYGVRRKVLKTLREHA